jgi:hypothetical protein
MDSSKILVTHSDVKKWSIRELQFANGFKVFVLSNCPILKQAGGFEFCFIHTLRIFSDHVYRVQNVTALKNRRTAYGIPPFQGE